MHKLFIILAFSLAACGNSADTTKPTQATAVTSRQAVPSQYPSLPAGFTVVEQSLDGYFIRLASVERASSSTIRELADSLSCKFDRVDLCLSFAHERGDEYLSIIDDKVYDYKNNSIYSIKAQR